MTTKKEEKEAPSAGPHDAFKAILDELVTSQTITADVAGIIKHALDHKAKK